MNVSNYDDTWLRQITSQISQDLRDQRQELQEHMHADAKALEDLRAGVAKIQTTIETTKTVGRAGKWLIGFVGASLTGGWAGFHWLDWFR